MSTPQAYKVLKTRTLGGVVYASAGETVYQCILNDYGKVDADARAAGAPHTYVTTRPNGDYPAFTIPSADIQAIAIFHQAAPDPLGRRKR